MRQRNQKILFILISIHSAMLTPVQGDVDVGYCLVFKKDSVTRIFALRSHPFCEVVDAVLSQDGTGLIANACGLHPSTAMLHRFVLKIQTMAACAIIRDLYRYSTSPCLACCVEMEVTLDVKVQICHIDLVFISFA